MEVYDTAEERDSRSSTWSIPKGCSLTRVYDKTRATSVRQFITAGTLTDIEPSVAFCHSFSFTFFDFSFTSHFYVFFTYCIFSYCILFKFSLLSTRCHRFHLILLFSVLFLQYFTFHEQWNVTSLHFVSPQTMIILALLL